MSHYPERPGDLTDAELAEWLRSPDLEAEHRKVLQREALHRLPVRRLQGGGYVVASRTTRGAWWLVQPGQGCTCPAEVERCHHMRVVAGYCLLDSAIHARPTPPPNISALCD